MRLRRCLELVGYRRRRLRLGRGDLRSRRLGKELWKQHTFLRSINVSYKEICALQRACRIVVV